MDALGITLAIAALLAGLTGTWSPCGFSMIETIGPAGHDGGRATTLSACIAFTLGALVGGVVTFGLLALAGGLLQGTDHGAAYVAAAAIAVVGAALELRGVPILPQLRRQLPEHWRRVMPMPVAAGLYGILLGLGFTTFVLTFGVFALAAIVFAVGEPAIGIAVGLAFGIGRALPIALIAPVAGREAGISITEAMAERPAIYRGFRFGDGLALLAAAAALIVAVPAGAAHTESKPAADPSVGGDAIVFQRGDGRGYVRRGSHTTRLPGHDPALGGGRIAVIAKGRINILSAQDLHRVGSVPAAGADAVAISGSWVIWRVHHGGRDSMRARKVTNPASPGPQRSLGRAGSESQLGRPALDGNRLVYARAQPEQNAIVKRVLGGGQRKHAKSTPLRSRVVGLSSPSLQGDTLLYVRSTPRGDRLKIKALGARGSGRTIFRRPTGTMWSTALAREARLRHADRRHPPAPEDRLRRAVATRTPAPRARRAARRAGRGRSPPGRRPAPRAPSSRSAGRPGS